jgi:beta-carotene 3-hydroxylase
MILKFILVVVLTFVAMEVGSYLLHRFLFHGMLWKIHKTHHETSKGTFEFNDLFSLLFTISAMLFILHGTLQGGLASITLPAGVGITLYGILYFFIHDLFTHRRFYAFASNSKLMWLVRRAHQNHHQSVAKKGQEPYGLFLFDYQL